MGKLLLKMIALKGIQQKFCLESWKLLRLAQCHGFQITSRRDETGVSVKRLVVRFSFAVQFETGFNGKAFEKQF